jgi:hypothetical protein
MIINKIGGAVVLPITILGGLVAGTEPAKANSYVHCRITHFSSLGVVTGGCSGWGPGQDAIVVRCQGRRGVVVHRQGRWMSRYQSWSYTVTCPPAFDGWRATHAWFVHR